MDGLLIFITLATGTDAGAPGDEGAADIRPSVRTKVYYLMCVSGTRNEVRCSWPSFFAFLPKFSHPKERL